MLLGLLQIMQLGSRFQRYSVQRASQITRRLQPQYENYLEVAKAHAQVLDAAVADLEAKADMTHKQKADGESFRGVPHVDCVHVVSVRCTSTGLVC